MTWLAPLCREGQAVLHSTSSTGAESAQTPLHRVASAAAKAHTVAQVGGELIAALHAVLTADQVHMLEIAQDRASGQTTVSGPGFPSYDIVFDERPSAVARVVASGQTLHVPDARATGEIRHELVEAFDVASALFLPVTHDDEVRQVAIAITHAPRTFTREEIADAETLIQVAAAGLSRIDAVHRRTARAAHDRALVRAARALNQSLELHEVLRTLAHEAALALGADIAGVYLGNAREGGVATAGHNVAPEWHGIRLEPGEGAAGQALLTGSTYVTNDYRSDTTGSQPSLRGFRTAVAVPMVWNDELKGALSVGWTTMRRVEEEDRRTLEAIADLATVACHNAETYHDVQQAARTDALTGLLNHGAMQVRVREEIARARRDATPLSFVIIDLDDFKRVNDVRGHQAGDELLRQVAGLLQAELRPYDQVARYGGDEFVLLLPGSDEATARMVAERVRDAMAASMVGGCSLGVAQWHEPLDADALLEHADRALLLAKRTGKGRVAVANPDVERELAMLQAQRGSPAAVQALAAAIEERDNYTHEHSEEVVHLVARRRHAARAPERAGRADRARRAAARRRQAGGPARDPPQARPADARGVGADGRAPGGRRADPAADPGPVGDRPGRAPRARALGRQRLPGPAGGPPDPDRLAHHPRLRRLPRDDDRPPLSGGDVARRGGRRAAPRRRHAVRPRRGRRAAGPARAPAAAGARSLRGRANARRPAPARAAARLIPRRTSTAAGWGGSGSRPRGEFRRRILDRWGYGPLGQDQSPSSSMNPG